MREIDGAVLRSHVFLGGGIHHMRQSFTIRIGGISALSETLKNP